jgi:homoserine dehydrogenase
VHTVSGGDVPSVRVALLGCGNVGAALVGVLGRRADELAVQSGARIELAGIAVADPSRPRPDHVPAELLGGDAERLVADPGVDIVVELIGGLEPAGSLVRAAIEAGKSVVTANKALLASAEGVELRRLAASRGVDLLYEASVAGAIPLVRALRQSLTGERIHRVMGIVNGTTNFILSRMAEEGAAYDSALAEAQRLGFAERDPTADVEGFDAAAKAAILAGVAFGYDVAADDVLREGITGVQPAELAYAARTGFVLKLLAIVERTGDDALSVRVHPTLVPRSHPLASVREAFNAVFIEGEAAGELMLYGQGAGGLPTASAVVGDLIDATRNRLAGTSAPAPERRPARLLADEDLETEYLLGLDVEDRPGVLATVSGVLGRYRVSIRTMEQDELAAGARLRFVTHQAREGDVRAALDELAGLDIVRAVDRVLRLVGDGR